MKIKLIVVGKQEKDFEPLVLEYRKRISRYADFELIETTDEKLESVVSKYERIFLLDEKGKEYTTIQFSDYLQKQMNMGGQNMCFVIGGAYGFSDELRQKANQIISMSKLTFPHQLARVVFVEQLYRAFTVIKNEKYHHEG